MHSMINELIYRWLPVVQGNHISERRFSSGSGLAEESTQGSQRVGLWQDYFCRFESMSRSGILDICDSKRKHRRKGANRHRSKCSVYIRVTFSQYELLERFNQRELCNNGNVTMRREMCMCMNSKKTLQKQTQQKIRGKHRILETTIHKYKENEEKIPQKTRIRRHERVPDSSQNTDVFAEMSLVCHKHL